MKKKIILLLSLLLTWNTGICQSPVAVAGLYPGASINNPTWLTAFQGKLFYMATDNVHGRELWSYDGVNPPVFLSDIRPGTGSGGSAYYNCHMGILNGQLYFPADDGVHGGELFAYDGSNAPRLVADVNPGPGTANVKGLVATASCLVFSASSDGSQKRDLYAYSTSNGLTQVPIAGGPNGLNPVELTLYNNKVYFNGWWASGTYQLLMLDPATLGTPVLIPIGSNAAGPQITSLTVGGGKLYFSAVATATGRELYSYDGTTVTRLTDLAPGTSDGLPAYGGAIGFLNGSVIFSGSSDGVNFQLYKYNPTSGQTTLVSLIAPVGSADPDLLTEFNGCLYFTAASAGLDYELWKTDGTTSTLVADLNPGASGSEISDLYAWNGGLYFNATNGVNGYELFRLGGTTGIQAVAFPGTIKAYPNPTQGDANLVVDLSQPQTLQMEVTDASGRLISNTACTPYNSGETRISLPLGAQPSGTYFYNVCTGEGRRVASGSLIRQ